MKTCPYGIMATFDYYHREYYLLLDKAKHMTKEEYDGLSIHNETDGVLKSIICRGVDCGRYALCNQQSPKGQQKEKEHRIYAIAFSLFAREKNIVLRVLEKYGPEAVERMSRNDWLKQRDCGAKSVENIIAALHGHKEGES